MMRLMVLMLASLLAGCSEGAAPDRPWQGYATNLNTSQIEYLEPDYLTRSDCLHGTKWALEKGKEQIFHRAPYGCLYNG